MLDPFGPQLDACRAALVARPTGATRTSPVLKQGASLRASNSFVPSAKLRFWAARTIRSSPAGLRAKSA